MSIEDLEFPMRTNKEQLLSAIDRLRDFISQEATAAAVGSAAWTVMTKVVATYGRESVTWMADWIIRMDRAGQGLCQYTDGKSGCESSAQVSGLCHKHAKALRV